MRTNKMVNRHKKDTTMRNIVVIGWAIAEILLVLL